MTIADVPSPVDLRLLSDASAWESTAMEKRPWRTEFFAKIAHELKHRQPPARRVLELGSGPGFLATHLFNELPDVSMMLLDFSDAMHASAKRRLGTNVERAEFLCRNFKDPDWTHGLQVHELRHKRHAGELHRQVRSVLRPGGFYLVCDHFHGAGGMSNEQLYMTVAEQKTAMELAGYASVREILLKGGLVLHHAVSAGPSRV
jgi:ubiquinone/menaquinone biosynthesis C-methylase UbiE